MNPRSSSSCPVCEVCGERGAGEAAGGGVGGGGGGGGGGARGGGGGGGTGDVDGKHDKGRRHRLLVRYGATSWSRGL